MLGVYGNRLTVGPIGCLSLTLKPLNLSGHWQWLGDGIYKSSDGDKTWARMGLEMSGQIDRIIIHPRDPGIVFAAALEHYYGP